MAFTTAYVRPVSEMSMYNSGTGVAQFFVDGEWYKALTISAGPTGYTVISATRVSDSSTTILELYNTNLVATYYSSI